jgi:hypothetical protein
MATKTTKKADKRNTKPEVRTANLVPKKEKGKKTAIVHASSGKFPDGPATICGIWSPKVPTTTDLTLVTCTNCLNALNSEGKPKREPKPDVTIICQDCGAERIVKAGQAHSVTRCIACQKKHLKAKRREAVKSRKRAKRADIRQWSEGILEGIKGNDEAVLRDLATLIRERYPKPKKGNK